MENRFRQVLRSISEARAGEIGGNSTSPRPRRTAVAEAEAKGTSMNLGPETNSRDFPTDDPESSLAVRTYRGGQTMTTRPPRTEKTFPATGSTFAPLEDGHVSSVPVLSIVSLVTAATSAGTGPSTPRPPIKTQVSHQFDRPLRAALETFGTHLVSHVSTWPELRGVSH